MFGFGNDKEIEVLDEYFKEFVNFVQLKQNKIAKRELKYSSKTNAILDSWNKLVDDTASGLKNDTKIMGEVVLLTDKMEQGIFGCRVHGNPSNPLIYALKVNINKMADEIEKDIKKLKNTIEHYTSNDFRSKVDINPNLKADMLSVMNGINTLGNALSTSAKQNLSNGQQLESNSTTMTDSVTNLANKANQQAASLEE
ncbi:MAG: methyl-accepting chemotaxis protein, partial [Campylobacterota bacterium]|nr:methyl-accepting chemotaxis protein [Campylobacterota bacterium]